MQSSMTQITDPDQDTTCTGIRMLKYSIPQFFFSEHHTANETRLSGALIWRNMDGLE